MGCKKCAEEVCGCETKEADTQTFEAHRKAPSIRDVNNARSRFKSRGWGTVMYDRYLVDTTTPSKITGKPANKYYYTAIYCMLRFRQLLFQSLLLPS